MVMRLAALQDGSLKKGISLRCESRMIEAQCDKATRRRMQGVCSDHISGSMAVQPKENVLLD